MDAQLQKLIDKLDTLDFSDMYENDFLLTWDKSKDDLEAVIAVANASASATSARASSTRASASPSSVTTPPAPASPSRAPATCSA